MNFFLARGRDRPSKKTYLEISYADTEREPEQEPEREEPARQERAKEREEPARQERVKEREEPARQETEQEKESDLEFYDEAHMAMAVCDTALGRVFFFITLGTGTCMV